MRGGSCIGNKQLVDDIPNLHHHGQRVCILINTRYLRCWRDPNDKYPFTYNSHNLNIIVKEAIYFHTQLIIKADNKQMCFASETVPDPRVLHFLIIFILKRCTSWPRITEAASCMSNGGRGLQHISATSGDYKTQQPYRSWLQAGALPKSPPDSLPPSPGSRQPSTIFRQSTAAYFIHFYNKRVLLDLEIGTF